jgi:hypothetical protein
VAGWQQLTKVGPQPVQGCQMVFFETKNPNLGKFWRVLQLKISVYFMPNWSILGSFGIFCSNLVYLKVLWNIFPVLMFCAKRNLATLIPCRHRNIDTISTRVSGIMNVAIIEFRLSSAPIKLLQRPCLSHGRCPSSATPPVTPSPGLPDCIFSSKNPYLGKFWKVLQLKLLVYFMSNWYILRPFSILCCYLVYFFLVLVCCRRIIWQPWPSLENESSHEWKRSCRSHVCRTCRKKRETFRKEHKKCKKTFERVKVNNSITLI